MLYKKWLLNVLKNSSLSLKTCQSLSEEQPELLGFYEKSRQDDSCFTRKKKDFLGLLLLLLFGPTSSTFPSDQGLSAFSTESAIYEFLLRSYWNYLLKYEHSVLEGKGKFRPQKALDEISKDKSFT